VQVDPVVGAGTGEGVSRDGNYLLNVGPRRDGVVTTGSVNALTGIGAWMSTCSDSIHGTAGSPAGIWPTSTTS
jgi:alpha-L-fucosidase